jgi:hypothetical protein
VEDAREALFVEDVREALFVEDVNLRNETMNQLRN